MINIVQELAKIRLFLNERYGPGQWPYNVDNIEGDTDYIEYCQLVHQHNKKLGIEE